MALLAYNRKKQYYAAEVEGLIKQLTSFEEGGKNYQEVEKYIFSNIIHHNFATVDISSVQRSTTGIAEKFKIHGLGKRGERFEELVAKYVSSDSSHHSQLNVQWHVLLLLLKLAYKPTSVSENELLASLKNNLVEPLVPEEDINWSEYLKEGIEGPDYQSDVSEEDKSLWLTESEDEETEEPTSTARGRRGCELVGYGEVPHPSLWRHPLPLLPSRHKVVREGLLSEEWLRSHVQHTWWSDKSSSVVSSSSHPSARMSQLWDLVSQAKDSSPLTKSQVVSEYKVLQEVLWMLQISTETCLFQLDDEGVICVKPNVSLASTVPESLQQILDSFCPYFNMIRELRQFEEDLNNQELSDDPPPVTFKAYCAAVFYHLRRLNSLVLDIQCKLSRQDETMTLLSVLGELTSSLNLLSYLYDVHTRAVKDWVTQPNWLCTTRLLSVVYESLLEASEAAHIEVSLSLFVHSFHAYLDIIDVWLSEGRLEDWRNEFLVFRDKEQLVVMPYEEEMRKCGVIPVSVLIKLVRVVTDAGHTMEVVSKLNKLTELRDNVQNKGCLFKEFSGNVYREVKRLNDGNIDEKDEVSFDCSLRDMNATEKLRKRDSSVESFKSAESYTGTGSPITPAHTLPKTFNTFSDCNSKADIKDLPPPVPKYLQEWSGVELYNKSLRSSLEDNPLLAEALSSYFQPSHSPPPSHKQSSFIGDSVSLIGLASLHGMLERQLELVVRRHRIASRLVTQTLRTEYRLMDHFNVLRTVFCMESGNLAQTFYSFLFKEIECGTWNNPLSLSVHLQMCVEEFFPGFGHFISILTTSKEVTDDVHKAIPAITLQYKVEWPVSDIVTPASVDSYNKVFRFLLHLKYAFWTLHNVRYLDLTSSTNVLRVRRLQVLKLWMYHSTNTLHSYFMGLVLRSYSTHLDESTQLADSIDIITRAHTKYLEEIKTHCLQDKKTHVERFIMKLLKSCKTLSDYWQKEAVGSLTDQDLRHLEEQYMMSYRGLVHCLDVVTSEEASNNFLFELKAELSHSEPVLI